ncbi:unnamed protein product [Didymodactylos carnosus]|uniref:Uncharacterized protein n=1 Tax=Didymodactylos carnosus TaxID=1234261 RepID=A0A814CF49_9BILA|nr:unnamed protein product [Didymodactylos carnosus]CAF0942494.1 unnamed protein product [Didymodactylos carnosus]CAF3644453.1 unnamed protein product [Didymodactylos carnosus]CAF3718847.1 unnamed protein product [Didymodactylos carnosus]
MQNIQQSLKRLIIFRRFVQHKQNSSTVPSVKDVAKQRIKDLRVEYDKPVQFSSSAAKEWDTLDSLIPNRKNGIFNRPLLLSALVINLIYWGFLREENDLDVQVSRQPWEILPKMNIEYLRTAERQYAEAGLDTSTIEAKKQIFQDTYFPQVNEQIRVSRNK